MTYFRFEATDEQHDSTLTKEFEAVQLQDILEEFQYFLKGCGFEFDGNIEIVPEELKVTGDWGLNLDGIYDDSLYMGLNESDLSMQNTDFNIEVNNGQTNSNQG